MFSLLNHPLVCRCCLLKQPPLYHNIHDAHLSAELKILAPQLHVEPNDGLTDVICDFCLHRLQDALEFRRKCLESEQVLLSRHEQWQRTVAAGEALALDDVLECLEREVGSLEEQRSKPVAKPVAHVAPLMEYVDFSSLGFQEPSIQCHSSSSHVPPATSLSTWEAGTLNTPHHLAATLEEEPSFIASESSAPVLPPTKAKTTHSSTTPRSLHPCLECEKKFTRNFQLKLHMISVHGLGELRYQCEVCHKSFASRHSLRYHFKSLHSTERPFSCEKCQKKFVLRTQLVSHLRTHTGESKPRIYACPKCTKSWPTKSDLRTHMRSHNPDMERPFKCDRCEKAFFTRGHLNSHILVHTGEKPYACDFCDKCYQSVGNLNNHMMRQHADIIEAELENGVDEC